MRCNYTFIFTCERAFVAATSVRHVRGGHRCSGKSLLHAATMTYTYEYTYEFDTYEFECVPLNDFHNYKPLFTPPPKLTRLVAAVTLTLIACLLILVF